MSTFSSAREWIPGFRLGSTSLDLGGTSRLGTGPFVFEGDEYTSAPWDPRPKFLHTRPHGACVTRLELDHPDVYASLEAYREPFLELARTMPAGGVLALCADDPECLALRDAATSVAVTYGTKSGSDWLIERAHEQDGMQRFRVQRNAGPLDVVLTFPGLHNAQNACAALILAEFAGVDPGDGGWRVRGLPRTGTPFSGPREVAGVAVVDDYAHHPTEVAAAIEAARQRYPGRRLVAIHTPHTYSRVSRLLEDYRSSFTGADVVIIGPIEEARERGMPRIVSSQDVADRAGPAHAVHVVGSSDEAIELVTRILRPGDVVLVLSLGGFDKLAPRLRDALEAQGVRR